MENRVKVSDYIVETLIAKGITDVFGYPGGMVTHLMDSFDKYHDSIKAHNNYHEQASAFAACGYSSSMRPGVAYATSGPGATNLITGICNAYFDSVPTIFITGQVNTYESKEGTFARQKGFQETDIVSMVKCVTKYSTQVNNANKIKYCLQKAYFLCLDGRPGPVLLDIPMDVLRADIEVDSLEDFIPNKKILSNDTTEFEMILNEIKLAKRPCVLVGAGIKTSGMTKNFREMIKNLKVPVVSSMLAVDVMSPDEVTGYGFIGAYGDRAANFILDKSDLIVSFGSRLDYRQTGNNLGNFAANAKLIRIDVDPMELTNKVKQDEYQIIAKLEKLVPYLNSKLSIEIENRHEDWLQVCSEIRDKLKDVDKLLPNNFVEKISQLIEDDTIITTDVGQNQVWIAQSFQIKENQKILFSGGHGAMGYSLPAAIGAYYGYKQKVVSFNGDGGIQMNIQELQTIAREQLPIKIIIFNNHALGMIRHFQEMYFDSNYVQTKSCGGYTVPDFEKIASAYELRYLKLGCLEEVSIIQDMIKDDLPIIIEVALPEDTYVYPKLAVGNFNNDQEPTLDRKLYEYLIDL